jgi:class 3 adenylate cyclase
MRKIAAGLLLLAGASGAQEPVTLAPGDGPVAMAGHIAVLADPTGAWTLADVQARSAEFATGADETFSFGYSGLAYWYRVTLANPGGSSNRDWVIELGRPVLDYVDLHVTRPDGTTLAYLTGDRRQAPPGQLPYRTFAFPLAIAPGETVTVHVRAQTAGAHSFQLAVRTPVEFQSHVAADTFIQAAVLSALLVIALYNAIIGLRLRDRTYLCYVALLFSVVAAGVSFNGYARQFVNPLFDAAPAIVSTSAVYLQALTNVFNLLFVREFLQLREHAPRLYKVYTALIAFAVATLLAAPALGFTLTDQVNDAYIILGVPFGFAVVTYLAIRGSRAARVYLLAWSIAMVGVLVTVLQMAGLLPGSGGIRSYAFGVVLAVIVLSLALADRVESERREREKLSRLKRFFAPEVADAILAEGEAALLAPKRREITVLFTDLRGFTAFSAESEPEEVIRVLREYREVIVALAAKHHGTLEHFSGDGVMVYFNAPVEIAEPEASAARMAFDLQRELGALCETWRRRAHELGVGIGMASGFATVGAVGFKDRMDYSVIGDVTNLAARLCGKAQHGQILVSRKLLLKVEKLVAAEPLGEHELKGLPRPVTVYNLRGQATA